MLVPFCNKLSDNDSQTKHFLSNAVGRFVRAKTIVLENVVAMLNKNSIIKQEENIALNNIVVSLGKKVKLYVTVYNLNWICG